MYNDSSFAEGYAIGRDSTNNNGYNNGMFGGDWSWFLIILLIFGWGGFGNGFGNNGGGFMNGALTRNDLCQEFSFNDLQSAVRGISNGICDSTFALNNTMTNGFAGVQQTLCQGFGGVNTAITTNGYETRGAISDLGYRLQDCCCRTNQNISDLGYKLQSCCCDLERGQANIIQASNQNTQRIIDYLCSEKISALQNENALLTAQLSQNAQTANINASIANAVSELRPVSKPAYITCSPYESIYGFGYGRNGYGNNGCGCGCGCN